SGYTFTGWNTSADGSGTSYAPGADLTLSNDTTLYAQWQKAVSLTYNPNTTDTVVAMPDNLTDQVINGQVNVDNGVPTRSGYTFTGWNTSADGSGTSYAPGAD
ncbi:InlB B-repeat-containing protein, partial [Lactococcus lactis]